MKVLHLVAGELTGGASRGAYWLHKALMKTGVDSYVLTNGKGNNGDASVSVLMKTPYDKIRFGVQSRLGNLPVHFYRNRQENIFNTGFGGIEVTRHPLYQTADIVHLHWINGLLSMQGLRKIKKPAVWTMRDMWPLTGGCHYSMDCDRYKIGCGKCPQLGSSSSADLSRAVVRYKQRLVPASIELVGISHWMSECAKASEVFRDYSIRTISNNIDTTEFLPVDRKIARDLLSLSNGKKIVLVGANNVTDFYKGFSLFQESLKHLDCKNIQFLFFGRGSNEALDQLGVEYTNLGLLTDTLSLRVAYSAADVFVAPSRMDAFGKTLAESMSCGTPVICFDATGPKDIVEHQRTGYKAIPFDSQDLAKGIDWVLGLPIDEYNTVCCQARARAISQFDSMVIAQQYKELYESII